MIHSAPTFGRWLNVGSQRDIQVVVEAARSGCCSSRCHALTFEHECDPHQPSHEGAPRASLRALADADAIVKWRVPDGMTSHVYAFEGRGGTFRISLTYDALTGVGKTNAHTDTYMAICWSSCRTSAGRRSGRVRNGGSRAGRRDDDHDHARRCRRRQRTGHRTGMDCHAS